MRGAFEGTARFGATVLGKMKVGDLVHYVVACPRHAEVHLYSRDPVKQPDIGAYYYEPSCRVSPNEKHLAVVEKHCPWACPFMYPVDPD